MFCYRKLSGEAGDIGGEMGGGDTVLCTLDTEGFVLTAEPAFFPEESPVNTLLRLRVRSGAFAGEGRLDVGRGALARFAAALDRLCRTLEGAAAIEEPYGFHPYIRFDARRGGYITVQGCFSQPLPGLPEQELRFAAQFDQTCLRPFVLELQKIIPNASFLIP